ncbi:hypothetical protein HJ01_00244 [Flavobacterium frigoris PS1]|uniref:Uncharacterized protein n=1 Tax=Flavobacterium frigoris (strain PS1) TaxID=1086011 RepID=H7FM46_FLAFP|nr:hypothetical protein HJ01_00244 [Flavobacterium frigoris PS1]
MVNDLFDSFTIIGQIYIKKHLILAEQISFQKMACVFDSSL